MSSPDQNQRDQNLRDQIQRDQIQGDQIQGDQNQGDQIQGEQNQGDQNQRDQIQGDQNQRDQIQGEQIQGDQNQRDQIQGDQSQGDQSQSSALSDSQAGLKKPIKLIFLIPLILFTLMVFLLASGLGKDPTELDSQLIGKPIPEFNKQLLTDPQTLISQADIQGPALINVFASWCPSCYHEHPYLMQLATDKTVTIFGLNYKDKRPAGLKFINDLGNPYEKIIFDDNGRLGIDMGVYGAPETFVVNRDNKIVYRHVGIVTPKVWGTILQPKMMAANRD